MDYKPLNANSNNKVEDKDKNHFYLRFLRLSNTQNLILIVVLTFMFYIISKQISVLINEQHYRNGKYYKSENEVDYQVDSEEYRILWNREAVEFFEKNLEISGNSHNNTKIDCDLGKEFFLMGMRGAEDNLEDYIWQILSLTAISSQIYYSNNNDVLQLRPFITETATAILNKLFTEISIPSTNLASKKCYNLSFSVIVGNRFPLNINHEPATTTYLLEQQAKRYVDVVKLNMKDIKKQWSFQTNLTDIANKEFIAAKNALKLNNENDINYVGLYIDANDKLDIPPEFYETAINFHRKLNPNSIFIVICEESDFEFFSKKLSKQKQRDMNIRVLKKGNEYKDFVVMSLCNSSIVTNTMGVLHGLFNTGEMITVFHPEKDSGTFIPLLVGKELLNWYPLS